MVSLLNKLQVFVQHSRDIVFSPGVVKRGRRLRHKVLTVPHVTKVKTDRDEFVEDEDTSQSIGNCMPRRNQRTQCISADHGPVKGQGDKSVAVEAPKEFVHNDVVRLGPADKGEIGKTLENPAWKPIPDERGNEHDQEVIVLVDLPAVGLRGIWLRAVVQRVKQLRVHEGRRPDHSRWPDEETSCQAGQPEARAEGRDAKQNLEAPAEVLLVPILLGDQNIRSIEETTAVSSLVCMSA